MVNADIVYQHMAIKSIHACNRFLLKYFYQYCVEGIPYCTMYIVQYVVIRANVGVPYKSSTSRQVLTLFTTL